MVERIDGYLPIEQYGAIGNLHTVALVGSDGSIDWCCLPELDSPSAFGALLDATRGGRFRVSAVDVVDCRSSYLPRTNVLETRFAARDGGVLELTDFMPVRAPIFGMDVPPAVPEILRLLRARVAPVRVRVEWSPRPFYASAHVTISRSGELWQAAAGAARLVLAGVPAGHERAGGVHAEFVLEPGQELALCSRWQDDAPGDVHRHVCERLRETIEAWRAWSSECERDHACVFEGRWQEIAVRCGLALKLLAHPDTGAIAAAATTSLPEQLGGVRNWDYRFTWVRDAALTGQALVSLGHRAEALEFLHFLQRTAQAAVSRGEPLQIMFGLHGETDLRESELPHLAGYRGSRPVRIGNAAAGQRQLDVFGELLASAQEFVRHGGTIPPDLWEFLALLVDQAAELWREPDHGIWEMRTEPRHFVHSKLMAWVALDGGINMAAHYAKNGRAPRTKRMQRWQRARAEVRAAILDAGCDRGTGAFVQSFGSTALDAANLLIPIVGFLPFDDPRVERTLDLTLEQLGNNGLVYRYVSDDGLPGEEQGAFGLTTCWAVDALTLSGRDQEAEALFERVLEMANPLWLYAEEFVPADRSFLGNFPQAFSHVGVINSALYLSRSHGQPQGAPAPMGTREHREETARH